MQLDRVHHITSGHITLEGVIILDLTLVGISLVVLVQGSLAIKLILLPLLGTFITKLHPLPLLVLQARQILLLVVILAHQILLVVVEMAHQILVVVVEMAHQILVVVVEVAHQILLVVAEMAHRMVLLMEIMMEMIIQIFLTEVLTEVWELLTTLEPASLEKIELVLKSMTYCLGSLNNLMK